MAVSTPGLDSTGRHTDREVAAVAEQYGWWPESEQEVQLMLGTFSAQLLILRMRWKALWLEASKPLRWFLDLATRAKGEL